MNKEEADKAFEVFSEDLFFVSGMKISKEIIHSLTPVTGLKFEFFNGSTTYSSNDSITYSSNSSITYSFNAQAEAEISINTNSPAQIEFINTDPSV
ncbi:4388_t:CDS:2 [Funneliformis mosseae]|uniref:4388_t:CDS:1 n=1 Tax=Funneliformis mosseae TaxID=27381 RepID=A0A9N9AW96_FUNMO|nr:4388_t:CDS:2 [Funneliformis mosseae]